PHYFSPPSPDDDRNRRILHHRDLSASRSPGRENSRVPRRRLLLARSGYDGENRASRTRLKTESHRAVDQRPVATDTLKQDVKIPETAKNCRPYRRPLSTRRKSP